jgi:hypothetical protein
VVGILAWLATQTLINIGAMLGLLPLKGITLPLVSYGGTSVVFILAALGVVFNISRYTTYAVPEAPARTGGRPAVAGTPATAAGLRSVRSSEKRATSWGQERRRG